MNKNYLTLGKINFEEITQKIIQEFPKIIDFGLKNKHHDIFKNIDSKSLKQYLKQLYNNKDANFEYNYQYLTFNPLYIDSHLNSLHYSASCLLTFKNLEQYQLCISFNPRIILKDNKLEIVQNLYSCGYFMAPLLKRKEIEEIIQIVYENKRFYFHKPHCGTSFFIPEWELIILSAKIYNINLIKIIEKISKKLLMKDLSIFEVNLTDSNKIIRDQAKDDVNHFIEYIPKFSQKLIEELEINKDKANFTKVAILFELEYKNEKL